MNTRIKKTFEDLTKQNKSAFISFITAGDPNVAISKAILSNLPNKGVDIIELGIPFSDPMADGVIIQEASGRALDNGITTITVFEMVADFRKKNDTTPIILMGYFNPILALGLETFAKRAKEAGVDGVLVVDLPPEEADDLKVELDKNEVDLIFLIAPTTDNERVELILQKASGFIYYVAVAGVTGTKTAKDEEVKAAINFIKKKTKLPVVSGFGIKTPEKAKSIAQIADGVVVGSAIVAKIADSFKNNEKPQNIIDTTLSFVAELAKSVKNDDNPN